MDSKSPQKSNPAQRPGGMQGQSDACGTGIGDACSTGQQSTSCENAHEGKLVKVTGNTLVMANCEGQEHSHTMAPDAKVSCDGTECRAQDLKPGSRIRVTTKPNDVRVATKVESLSKQADFAHSA